MKNWFEISLYEHWSRQPHGIARATQFLFLESIKKNNVNYFYYNNQINKFVVCEDVEYFLKIIEDNGVNVNHSIENLTPLIDIIKDGDLMLLTGASWGVTGFLEELKLLTEYKQILLASIIYDVIAHHSPHFFLKNFAELVITYQKEIVKISNHVACISKASESDVKNLLSGNVSLKTSVFELGSDFVGGKKAILNNNLKDKDYSDFILSVGTIEARKNHILLYYMMRDLIIRYGDNSPCLIIIGKPGWLSDNVMEFMTNDPLVNKKIHILNSVEDNDLLDFYKKSLFTIYPSFYEGYGLPIAESFKMGKICVSSNSSSIPEVNKFKELQFDPYNYKEAVKIVEMLMENNYEMLNYYNDKIKSSYVEHTWADSYEQLMKNLTQ
jgi:glycosyltransferase involved in cell wall biosynthesis